MRHFASISRRRLVGGALILPISSCGQADEDVGGNGRIGADAWALSYRIKMRAFAGGQIREGASVFRTIYRKTSPISLDQAGRIRTQTWGEAIAVNMGEGGYLFGMLGSVLGVSGGHNLNVWHDRAVIDVMPRQETIGENFSSGVVFERAALLQGEHALNPQLFPMLAHFTDPADLATAAFVPWPGGNDVALEGVPVRSLQDVFGREARIDAVTVEIVNARPSEQIADVLPSLRQLPGADGGFYVTGLEPGWAIRYDNFKLEGYRA